MRLNGMRRILSALLMVLAWHSPALSMEWVFEKILDTDTLVPGREEKFFGFSGTSLSLDSGNVAFYASYRDSADDIIGGIYAYIDGAVKLVADLETRLPDSTDTFQTLGLWPSMGETTVAFAGSDEPYAHYTGMGVYKDVMGQLHVVADTDTPVPEGGGNFDNAPSGGVSTDGGVVAFCGEGDDGRSGIYVEEDRILKKVADETTAIPQGSGDFTGFEDSTATSSTKMFEGNVAFIGEGQDDHKGIYKRVGSTLFRVADKNTPIPGGSVNFTQFDTDFAISDGNVAFCASGDGGRVGVYKEVEGGLVKVADQDTAIPEGDGAFEDFNRNAASISGRWVVFTGRDASGRTGVYTDYFGILQKVIGENNTLDGKTIYAVSTAKESFDEGCIVISVSFDDDSQGVYLARPAPAVIPTATPWGAALLVLLAAGMGIRGIRKKLKIEY